MLDDQDRDRLFEELKEKLELVEQRVKNLKKLLLRKKPNRMIYPLEA